MEYNINMNEELIKYWQETADDDFGAMTTMFDAGKYSWSLFIGHLVIEKLLKGLYAKVNPQTPHAPKIHDLVSLANKCKLTVNDDKGTKLEIITHFNIEARYDTIKREFNKICTKEFTAEQIEIIKEVRIWLKELLAQK
jgi:HEPN domain-containing protein